MPIFRLSAQECYGIVIDDDRARALAIVRDGGPVFAAIIASAMAEHNLTPQLCDPGIINITPIYWKRNRAQHIIEVLRSGESALYHVVPRDAGLAPAPFTPTSGVMLAQDVSEVKSIRIPQDLSRLPLMGPVAGDARLRLHEFIIHGPAMPQAGDFRPYP